jgi:PncC family amidohydrolase
MQDSNLFFSLMEQAETKAETLIHKLKKLSLTLALSESCTAGLVSSMLAGIPGASSVFWGSFVCYTQKAKVSMLGIDNKALTDNGLVSKETASSMADMAKKKSGVCIAAAVTGLAGPDGDGSNIPVGTVWVAVAKKEGAISTKKHYFTGNRKIIRIRAGIAVLEAVLSVLPDA